jgi:phosphomannomutase
MTNPAETLQIQALMDSSGVKFGTSGARGLADRMTDKVCYAYTVAFIQHLKGKDRVAASGVRVAIAGDLRPSSGRIMRAVAKAVRDRGHEPIHCGTIPSPAVAWYGISHAIPSIMVTGSHIPDDRNGIKYNQPRGEILKADEEGIRAQSVECPAGLFDAEGWLASPSDDWLPAVDAAAYRDYVRRYLDFFPAGCLEGLHIGLYEHSSVARECIYEVLSGLGARVEKLGFSERFVPVDTEAIRPEDVRLARDWAAQLGTDALVSADGDGDRPLISDEYGKWLRGDVAGVLCAHYLDADVVVTPVSCNTAVERSGWFEQVRRTRIGSPFVIEVMEQALAEGAKRVMGYEANGGFLIGSDLESDGRRLGALPTRDALVLHIAILLLARREGVPISRLLAALPQRFTASDRLKEFPTEAGKARLAALHSGDLETDRPAIEAVFGTHFGKVAEVNDTDGLRITFASGEVVHLRPSGNAPELRCYNEADSEARALEMNRICMGIMESWRSAAQA